MNMYFILFLSESPSFKQKLLTNSLLLIQLNRYALCFLQYNTITVYHRFEVREATHYIKTFVLPRVTQD